MTENAWLTFKRAVIRAFPTRPVTLWVSFSFFSPSGSPSALFSVKEPSAFLQAQTVAQQSACMWGEERYQSWHPWGLLGQAIQLSVHLITFVQATQGEL